MKFRIVPSSEVTERSLRARDYVPTDPSTEERLVSLSVRIANHKKRIGLLRDELAEFESEYARLMEELDG